MLWLFSACAIVSTNPCMYVSECELSSSDYDCSLKLWILWWLMRGRAELLPPPNLSSCFALISSPCLGNSHTNWNHSPRLRVSVPHNKTYLHSSWSVTHWTNHDQYWVLSKSKNETNTLEIFLQSDVLEAFQRHPITGLILAGHDRSRVRVGSMVSYSEL